MSRPTSHQPRFGARLRSQRKALGRTQREVAESAEISTAYLNLIENNRRGIPPALLERLVTVLGMDMEALTNNTEARLAEELEDLRKRWCQRNPERAAQLKEAFPDGFELVDFGRGWGEILLEQNRVLQRLDQVNRSLADRFNEDPEIARLAHNMLTKTTSIRSFAEILGDPRGTEDTDRRRFTDIINSQSVELGESIRGLIDLFETRMEQPAANSAREEIENFIIDRSNHFPTLELGAQDLRRSLNLSPDEPILEGELRRAVEESGKLPVEKNDWNASTTRFQMAKHLCADRLAHSIKDLVFRGQFKSETARQRAVHALSNYAAGAFLYPYEPFLSASEQLNFDIDLLVDQFGGGFEQIAHRLATLRRPGRLGINFGFMRVDPAGHISKRLNIPGLSMPRAGSACPLWIAYEAFQTPGRTVSQLAEMPNGDQFVLVAKAVEKRHRAFMRPAGRFSIMVAMTRKEAERSVYGDLYRGGVPPTPVGSSCQLCPRTDCPQRAEDSLLKL